MQKLALLPCLLLICLTSSAKVSFTGKIVGYEGKSKVSWQGTVDGILPPYSNELKPSSNGSFKFEFECNGLGVIILYYRGMTYRFLHDNNSTLYLEIREPIFKKSTGRIPGEKIFKYRDSLKQANTVRISGNYEAVNQFYNRNLRSSYFTTQMVDGNPYSQMIREAGSAERAMIIIDSLTQNELRQIDLLPGNLNHENPAPEANDKDVRSYLTNEVQAFYAAVFLNGMFLKRRDQYIKMTTDSLGNHDLYNRSWEVMVERIRIQADDLKPLPNSPDYLDFTESMAYAQASYQQYNFPQTTYSLDDDMIARLFKYDTTLFRDKKTREAYELKGLQRFLNDQLFYSPALLHSAYDLQNKYPNSSIIKYLEPKIDNLKIKLEVASHEGSKGKIIDANYKTFNSLLKRFEGKNIFIDVWATWCHPCVEEFKHKSVVQPFMDRDDIEVLYISIDKPEWEDRWRQSIKINDLEGYHFRAEQAFIMDMWNSIKGYEGAIPRYILINRKGELFKNTASRPSDGEKLTKEIEELVMLNKQ